jgi:exosortase A-associated hydrolase 1
MHTERALSFACGDERLVAVLSLPAAPARRGVLIIVGGPQYRAGSHRQFTLLARSLADAGVPVMRFDYRGMGDSEGAARTFEDVEADVGCALDVFFAEVPALQEAVLWGLCDGASAALFYAHRDARIKGLVLLNPWVRSAAGIAKAYLKHYYLARLKDRQFWRKLGTGEFKLAAAARSLASNAMAAVGLRRTPSGPAPATGAQPAAGLPLAERMCQGLQRFDGPVLLITSGNDLTAREFLQTAAASRKWRGIMRSSRLARFDLPDADHTFSTRVWHEQVARRTAEWTLSL